MAETQRSLSWAVRFLKSTLVFTSEQEVCLNTLSLRNDVVHDYVNSDIYKEDIAGFFTSNNRVECLYEIIGIIKGYLAEKNKF